MIILQSYFGIMINHDKDPYETTSAMESKRVFYVFFSWLGYSTLPGIVRFDLGIYQPAGFL